MQIRQYALRSNQKIRTRTTTTKTKTTTATTITFKVEITHICLYGPASIKQKSIYSHVHLSCFIYSNRNVSLMRGGATLLETVLSEYMKQLRWTCDTTLHWLYYLLMLLNCWALSEELWAHNPHIYIHFTLWNIVSVQNHSIIA